MSEKFYAVGSSPEETKAARYRNGQGDSDKDRTYTDRETATHEDWDGGDYNDPE